MGDRLDKRLARRFRAFKADRIFRQTSRRRLPRQRPRVQAVDLKNRLAAGATRCQKRRRDPTYLHEYNSEAKQSLDCDVIKKK